MLMAQSFPAWAEEGIISRATGVVWIILLPVQNDREKKQKTKNKKQKKTLLMVLVFATLWFRQKLPFRDVPM